MGSDFNSLKMSKAMQAIDDRDYSAALERLLPLAEAGHPKAQLNLATLYHLGLGVEADAQKAVELYFAVGEQNLPDEHLSSLAYHNLSTLYVCGGPGVRPSWERSIASYPKIWASRCDCDLSADPFSRSCFSLSSRAQRGTSLTVCAHHARS
jgi:TPR repeat protein